MLKGVGGVSLEACDGSSASVLSAYYPTDLTDAEWELLAPLIPAAKPGGRPAVHERREIVNALAYWVRAGCAWRLLPPRSAAVADGLPLLAHLADRGPLETDPGTLTRRRPPR
jgi:hypothetical protein